MFMTLPFVTDITNHYSVQYSENVLIVNRQAAVNVSFQFCDDISNVRSTL